MSKESEKISDEARDEQKNASVYDFLFYDKQRVGSFLAQFDASGHLQQITESESASKGAKRGYKFGIGGGASVMGTGGQGNLSVERTPGEHGSEEIQRVYDPLWANALTLLDYLTTEDLIVRDVTAGRLGQFVIASGNLSILNPALMKKAWDSPHIRDQTKAAGVAGQKALWNANPQNAALPPKQKAEAEKAFLKIVELNATGMLDLMASLPQSTQCTIQGNNFAVWSTLPSDGMIGAVTDLALKHGTEIPGVWHLLGILDALPSPIPPPIIVPFTGILQHLSPDIKNISNLSRTLLGRAADAYGMTALLLFREVTPGTTGI